MFKRFFDTKLGQGVAVALVLGLSGAYVGVLNTYAATVDKVGGRAALFGHGPTPGCQVTTWDVTAAQAAAVNTYFQGVKVKAGTTMIQGAVRSTDMDAGTALVWDVGYGESSAADDLLDGSTIGQAGGTAPLVGFPLTFTADDTIDVKVATAAGTGAAGQFTLELCALNNNP